MSVLSLSSWEGEGEYILYNKIFFSKAPVPLLMKPTTRHVLEWSFGSPTMITMMMMVLKVITQQHSICLANVIPFGYLLTLSCVRLLKDKYLPYEQGMNPKRFRALRALQFMKCDSDNECLHRGPVYDCCIAGSVPDYAPRPEHSAEHHHRLKREAPKSGLQEGTFIPVFYQCEIFPKKISFRKNK